MGWILDSEEGVKRVSDAAMTLTRIPPASFRGVDCSELAARYAAYRRNAGLDQQNNDPDEIKLQSAQSAAETV